MEHVVILQSPAGESSTGSLSIEHQSVKFFLSLSSSHSIPICLVAKITRINLADLAYDTPQMYEANWGQKNETEADAYWEELDASPVIVALRYEEAASKYGLPKSVQFPWDNEKGLYYIKAFHHIHCLVSFHPKARNHHSLTLLIRNSSVKC